MKIREIIRQIENDGWFHVRTRGSHRLYHHATKSARQQSPDIPDKNCTPKR